MPTRETLTGISWRIANAQNDTLSESARRIELQEARSLLEAEFSHDETRRLLYTELRKNRFLPDGTTTYRYIRAVYDGYFIYEQSSGDESDLLFRCDYSTDEAGAVTLGVPVAVREETKFVPVENAAPAVAHVTESGKKEVHEQTISLRESVIGKDGLSLVKIISPGKGSSGFYPRKVIERDVPIVFPKGTQMFANHASLSEAENRPEGDIERMVGQFVEDPIYLEESAAPEGEGSYVKVEFFDDWKPTIKAKGHAVGISINGEGEFNVSESGEIEITRLVAGQSVDVVTRAGRGGKIVSLREAAKQLHEAGPNQASVPTIQPNNKEEENMTPEQIQAMEAENKRLNNEIAVLKAKEAATITATKAIESLNLPAGARARIIESQTKKPVLTADGALDTAKFETQVKEAAADEIRYATENYGWGGGNPDGLGDGNTETKTTRESAVKVSDDVDSIRASMGL